MDESLSLMDKWMTPTRLMPSYLKKTEIWNALAGIPGVFTVIFLGIVLHRHPGVLKQYQCKYAHKMLVPQSQYTVVLITFGGYLLMLPVLLFNVVVAAILTYYDGRNEDESMRDQFKVIIDSSDNFPNEIHLTSSWIPNELASNINCLIDRYVSKCQKTRSNSLLLYVIYIIFFGVVVRNDCCELTLEVPEIATPIFSSRTRKHPKSVAPLLISDVSSNCRDSTQHSHTCLPTDVETETNRRRIDFVLASSTRPTSINTWLPPPVNCSTTLLRIFHCFHVLGPAWFSTYTNVACYLSTLLNPIAAMCANTEPVAVTTTLESLLPLNDCQTEKMHFIGEVVVATAFALNEATNTLITALVTMKRKVVKEKKEEVLVWIPPRNIFAEVLYSEDMPEEEPVTTDENNNNGQH
uniref:Uncharacterized protein n=1 Tax=Pristionchus pacificus TaxID=54126 RepID=A0A8R1YSM5_PRIPA